MARELEAEFNAQFKEESAMAAEEVLEQQARRKSRDFQEALEQRTKVNPVSHMYMAYY